MTDQNASKRYQEGPTVKRSVKVALTQEEELEFGQRLVRAIRDHVQAERDLASFKADIKSRMEHAKSEVGHLQNCINEHAEWRDMQCNQVLDFDTHTVEIVRPDTGEVVGSRDMTAGELQMEMRLIGGEEPSEAEKLLLDPSLDEQKPALFDE